MRSQRTRNARYIAIKTSSIDSGDESSKLSSILLIIATATDAIHVALATTAVNVMRCHAASR